MKVVRLVGAVVLALGTVLAVSMFAMVQYIYIAHPTEIPIVPGLLLYLGVAIAVIGLLLLAVALAGSYFMKGRGADVAERRGTGQEP